MKPSGQIQTFVVARALLGIGMKFQRGVGQVGEVLCYPTRHYKRSHVDDGNLLPSPPSLGVYSRGTLTLKAPEMILSARA
mmetsp:Transcript_103854/g.175725  ORF Transcript_103854/g.175725 Transcript_103854/m.175725 type:complete len:80 (+) Transcript_103854:497-736(+)|eukprot:CAMPEP_0174386122 /NCGR_PEP_ID=MMETSP0811_2-20130205/127068_1 /TAXON_ID=73025 ORGANISM="Eutreptiella gymnastica-like, Strain CCMP1594" /NCGR_SAMPLE_ID=MMETSP0811_2 /ASSEMBLY_ACC=CAM_ASM_000667 /LENGTH=79 /DNA_ID=CAMNT_0015540691 /DNA_START=485 /DNA_END=724 /DNA_ORIENTATION=-